MSFWSRNFKLKVVPVTFIVLFSQLTLIDSSLAATVTATGAHPSPAACDQTVSDATNVDAVRLAGGDCVVSFKSGNVNWTSPQGLTTAQILLVGGGGGGGGTFDTRGAGGGGAGSVKSDSSFNVNGTSVYEISVGAKGAGGLQPARTNAPQNVGSNGGNSTISLGGSSLLIAYGGLGGCASRTTLYEVYCTTSTDNGTGGAAATSTAGGGRGGATGGGGGGSSGAGGAAIGGAGGAGTTVSITGSSITYGIGGNGGVNTANAVGTSASANTGNGGRGASSSGATNYNGGDGGSGIVVVRFSPDFVPSAPTINSVSAGDKSLTVTFTAGFAGSAAITDYEYSLNSGSYISTGTTASPFTISGLNGRTSFSVTLKARNSVGLSAASSALSATTIDVSLDSSEAASKAKAELIAYNGKIALELVTKLGEIYTDLKSVLLQFSRILGILYLIVSKIQ